jgi:FkbM family methyltransferase
MDYRISFLILPFTRFELTGWRFLAKLFNVEAGFWSRPSPDWEAAPLVQVINKYNGYRISLDLANWSERLTFFLGRFYELDIQFVLSQVLQPGDRFVDIGANIGQLTLHGAALVTDSGCVDSFEPNPICGKRLRENLDLNGIKHVNFYGIGLSDQPGDLVLHVDAGISGLGTFAELQDDQTNSSINSFEVPVLTGDEVIMQNSTPVKLVKIDVEGFELRVLKGLKQSLSTWHPIVVMEFDKRWLERAGTSRSEVLQFMSSLGYSLYGITMRKQFFQDRLVLVPVLPDDCENVNFIDVLWLHPESQGSESVRPFIQSA